MTVRQSNYCPPELETGELLSLMPLNASYGDPMEPGSDLVTGGDLDELF